jgi:protein gp37
LPLKWNAKLFYCCPSCGWRGHDPLPSGVDGVFACPAQSFGCQAIVQPTRVRVFCASLSDWLDNDVPLEWLADLLGVIRDTPQIDWLMLSKRIGNWGSRLSGAALCYRDSPDQTKRDLSRWIDDWVLSGNAPAHVWLGATVVTREEMLRDGPKLLAVPARVHFWSVEPMLGDLGEIPTELLPSWVICGGESGPRPLHPDWVRGLRDQCAAASVPFYFKQWGDHLPVPVYDAPAFAGGRAFNIPNGPATAAIITEPGGGPFRAGTRRALRPGDRVKIGTMLDEDTFALRIGKKQAGRLLDGREYTAFPQPSPMP